MIYEYKFEYVWTAMVALLHWRAGDQNMTIVVQIGISRSIGRSVQLWVKKEHIFVFEPETLFLVCTCVPACK